MVGGLFLFPGYDLQRPWLGRAGGGREGGQGEWQGGGSGAENNIFFLSSGFFRPMKPVV